MEKWITVKLGDLLSESKSVSFAPDPKKRLRVKLNVGGIEKRPEIDDKEGATKYYIRSKGQFIFGRQNLHKGAFGVIPPEFDGYESSADIPAFDVDPSCYPEWIYYFFKQGNFYLKLEQFTKGIGSKRINQKQLFDLKIFLPPKNEQERILGIIKNIENRLKEALAEFDYQFELIEKLSETTYLEAVKGQLSQKWRAENTPRETGKQLLDRLLKEKKRKKKNAENDLFSIQTSTLGEYPYTLPEGWVWTTLDDISDFISSGSRDWAKYYSAQGASFIRMGNLSKQSFDLKLDNIQKVLPPDSGEGTRTKLQTGDYLISITGEVGLLGLIPEDFGDAYINQHIALVRLSKSLRNKYFGYFFLSPTAKKQFSEPNRGIKNSFRLSDVRKINIPLPSIDEQFQIIERIESLVVYFNQLKGYIKKNKEDIQLLSLSNISELIGNPNDGIRLISSEDSFKKEKKQLFNNVLDNSFNTIIGGNMKLEELLAEHGKMSAVNLWKMSEYHDNIDKFYEELKKSVEVDKNIIESDEKGYLELSK